MAFLTSVSTTAIALLFFLFSYELSGAPMGKVLKVKLFRPGLGLFEHGSRFPALVRLTGPAGGSQHVEYQ